MQFHCQEIKIADVRISKRFRKDMGDLGSFAKSIDGSLLQPIGITPDHELIFGQRRLLAYRDVLHRDTIPARIIPVESVLHGQIDENMLRKSFTPSELVAVVHALRSFTHGGDRRSNQIRNCDNEMTTEKLAHKVGWSKDTYARAQTVIKHGIPELIEAMDTGKMSIYAASELAMAEPDEQRGVLARVPNEERSTAFRIGKRLRRIRTKKLREARLQETVGIPNQTDAIKIYHCPFQNLEQIAGIAPASVKLICTDIPYGTDFLPQIEELAAFAKRVLVPGGLFVSYVGQFRLNEKLALLDKHLKYHWLCTSTWDGEGNYIPQLEMVSKSIHIVLYANGTWHSKRRWIDTFRNKSQEKQWHEWQRPLGEIETIVQYFSEPGDLVIDVCGGSFTTAIACFRQNRQFVGCDIDRAAVVSGQQRLAEERAKREISFENLTLSVEV
jgi:hypothetical protein